MWAWLCYAVLSLHLHGLSFSFRHIQYMCDLKSEAGLLQVTYSWILSFKNSHFSIIKSRSQWRWAPLAFACWEKVFLPCFWNTTLLGKIFGWYTFLLSTWTHSSAVRCPAECILRSLLTALPCLSQNTFFLLISNRLILYLGELLLGPSLVGGLFCMGMVFFSTDQESFHPLYL